MAMSKEKKDVNSPKYLAHSCSWQQKMITFLKFIPMTAPSANPLRFPFKEVRREEETCVQKSSIGHS